jgi:hypothetical protein
LAGSFFAGDVRQHQEILDFTLFQIFGRRYK